MRNALRSTRAPPQGPAPGPAHQVQPRARRASLSPGLLRALLAPVKKCKAPRRARQRRTATLGNRGAHHERSLRPRPLASLARLRRRGLRARRRRLYPRADVRRTPPAPPWRRSGRRRRGARARLPHLPRRSRARSPRRAARRRSPRSSSNSPPISRRTARPCARHRRDARRRHRERQARPRRGRGASRRSPASSADARASITAAMNDVHDTLDADQRAELVTSSRRSASTREHRRRDAQRRGPRSRARARARAQRGAEAGHPRRRPQGRRRDLPRPQGAPRGLRGADEGARRRVRRATTSTPPTTISAAAPRTPSQSFSEAVGARRRGLRRGAQRRPAPGARRADPRPRRAELSRIGQN